MPTNPPRPGYSVHFSAKVTYQRTRVISRVLDPYHYYNFPLYDRLIQDVASYFDRNVYDLSPFTGSALAVAVAVGVNFPLKRYLQRVLLKYKEVIKMTQGEAEAGKDKNE